MTIVENRRFNRDTRLGWEIGAVPSLSISGAVDDPGHDLFNATDATRLAGGAIVVADAGSGKLRVFDASGAHRESWGGRGEGPAEFGNAAQSTVGPWQGDSIVASDTFARRVSVFGSNGARGRTFVLESPYCRVGLRDKPGEEWYVVSDERGWPCTPSRSPAQPGRPCGGTWS